MRRCFQLALKGLGHVAPNPLVGAVIVANNRIIGEGWHKKYGKAHAEVNAFNSVKPEDKHLIEQATIYVNLEPCSHYGKTPPCANLIVENKIKNVVICNVDSNPLVGGKGIEKIRESNIKVETGILEKEGRELNKRFFTFIEKNRPYIILKWAQTLDGFFAKSDGKQHWITTENTKQLVHKWRSEEAGILVGKNTALIDNPSLNNRYFSSEKQPVRIVIDQNLDVPKSYHIYNNKQSTIIYNSVKNSNEKSLQFCHLHFNKNLIINILQHLTKLKLQSVIIEGGANTLQQFIDLNLWDEARILTGNTTFNEGLQAPKLRGIINQQFCLSSDQITILKNTL